MAVLDAQEAVWVALSDLFVDNEIDHEHIARRVAHLSVSEVEHILFYEVAPICMSNLLVPISSIWQMFDENYIIKEIKQHLRKFNSNKFYHRKVRLQVKLYKILLKNDWAKVAAQIRKAHIEIG